VIIYRYPWCVESDAYRVVGSLAWHSGVRWPPPSPSPSPQPAGTRCVIQLVLRVDELIGDCEESCSEYSSSHAVVSRTLGSVPASRAGPVGSAAPCRCFLPGLGTKSGRPTTDTPPLVPYRRTMSPRGSLRGRQPGSGDPPPRAAHLRGRGAAGRGAAGWRGGAATSRQAW